MNTGIPIKNVVYKVEEIAPIHFIYLGSPAAGQIDEEYRQAAMNECAQFFQEFTVTRATGMFRGKLEETLIFYIATCHPKKIIELANRLCERFCQDGIGVTHPTGQGNLYSRVVAQEEQLLSRSSEIANNI